MDAFGKPLQKGGKPMPPYQGKHSSAQSWAIASSASGRGRHQVKNRRRRRWIIVLLVLILLIVIYPFAEARFLTTDKRVMKADDLPTDANHLHVVFVSDIHYGFWFSDGNLNNLVNSINGLKPDIVIFGGDYGANHSSALQFFRKLPKIHARYAVYGVLGETDRGETDYETENLTDTMRNAGVIPLVNDVATVRVGASSIWVAGVDDSTLGSPNVRSVASRVSSQDFVILASHNPSIIPDAHLATDSSGRIGWFDLGLFGHTHGGQMMFFSDLLGFTEDIPARYHSGWLTENRADLCISRGVGTSVVPARLFCPAQIHLIELTVN